MTSLAADDDVAAESVAAQQRAADLNEDGEDDEGQTAVPTVMSGAVVMALGHRMSPHFYASIPPPSMSITVPVRKPLVMHIRYTSAISSGCPMRPTVV